MCFQTFVLYYPKVNTSEKGKYNSGWVYFHNLGSIVWNTQLDGRDLICPQQTLSVGEELLHRMSVTSETSGQTTDWTNKTRVLDLLRPCRC